nr:MAG TPA: hypothetical protein [Caudoviricetes sp.]
MNVGMYYKEIAMVRCLSLFYCVFKFRKLF